MAKGRGASQENQEVEGCPVRRLLYWREPAHSGAALGAGLVVLLSVAKFSVVSVSAYALLVAVCAAVGFRLYKLVTARLNGAADEHPFRDLLDAPLPALLEDNDTARRFGEALFNKIVNLMRRARSLLLAEDIVESGKFIVGLWLLTYVGAWFNGLTLIILSWIGLFSLPRVYQDYQTEIDAQISKVTGLLTGHNKKDE